MYVSTRCKNVLLVAVSVFVALMLAEFVSRLILANPRKINHRDFYEHDDTLGWKKKSLASRNIKTSEFTAFEQTNSRGLRGEEYQYEKSRGEFRILVLGDSFTEGYTVNFNQLFSELLEQRLNERSDGRIYQVINAGTVGYGTDQELLFFENEGTRYFPDIVLLMFYENDVLENVSPGEMYGKYKKLFRIVDNQLLLDDRTASHHTDKTSDQGLVRPKSPATSFANKLALFRLVRDQMVHFGVLTNQDNSAECDLRFFEILSFDDSKETDQAWELTELLLQRLRDSVTLMGAQLAVFYIPSVYALDPLVWTKTAKKFGLSDRKWDLLKPEIRLRKVCDLLNIPFESLGDSFRKRAVEMKAQPMVFYHLGDGHWNELGHKEVSNAIYAFLTQSSILESIDASRAGNDRGYR